MSERLRPRDLAFLTDESPTTPRHNATIEIFEPGPGGFSFDRLLALVDDRIAFVPRYRQRVVTVPGHLANPVWTDAHVDLHYHVRRSALPRPGTLDQLRQLAGRIVSRPLDRQRPLWEIYVVEGLEHGRVALLHKTHQVLVDGVDTVDLGQMLLDDAPTRRSYDDVDDLDEITDVDRGGDEPDAGWRPRTVTSPAGLVVAAVRDTLAEPATAADSVRSGARSVVRTVTHTRDAVGRVVGGLAGRATVRGTPLSGSLSNHRRVVTVETPLQAYRQVREAHGGTVNDAILATVAGGLRAWLMTHGEAVAGQVRAVVPVSVIDRELESTSLGSPVAAHFVDLPVGEPSPVVRLHQVSYSFQAHRDTGRAVGADRLAGIAGFAPATFHAVGSRVALAEVRRGFALSVTNVPGPQTPLFAAGARMVASYPVPPLLPGQTLAIGVTSYDGTVFYGITADRDLVPDADLLGQCVTDALDELLDTTRARRVPRGRRKPANPSATPSGTTKAASKSPAKSPAKSAAKKPAEKPAKQPDKPARR